MWRTTERRIAAGAARLLLAAFAFLAIIPAAIRAEPPALRVVGYNDMDDMLGALTEAYRRQVPDARFELILKSTRSAPPALLDGSADLAPMGAELEPAERAAIRARWGADPVEVAVAHDSLTPGTLSSPTGVFVHRDNPLREISLSTLKRVFAGDTPPEWRALEVPLNGAVRPLGLGPETAIGRFLLRHILRTPGFTPGYRGFAQSRDAAAAVAADPAAIGFANLNHAQPGIRALTIIDERGIRRAPDARTIATGDYPLDRKLLIYARRDRTGSLDPRARAFLSFILSDTGQAIIARGRKGYLPLSPRERTIERRKLRNSVYNQ